MKGLFNEFSYFHERNFGPLWKEATFVFDTNVLFNLYRYRKSTSDELFEAIDRVAGQIWLPHHVGLEFQRNRLSVIAEQTRQYSHTKRIVEQSRDELRKEFDRLNFSKRHHTIDPEAFLGEYGKLLDAFTASLDAAKAEHVKILNPDQVNDRLENIFDGKTGSPPANQDELNKIYAEGERRFKLRIPPGYMDEGKEKDNKKPNDYLAGGLTYKRSLGDYLIWRQLLDHAKSSTIRSLIVVTGDVKEDWWLKIEDDGPKTIGPRPELIGEAKGLAGVDNLIFYNVESFLRFSNQQSNTKASEQALSDIREVSSRRSWREGGDLDSLGSPLVRRPDGYHDEEVLEMIVHAANAWLAANKDPERVDGWRHHGGLNLRAGERLSEKADFVDYLDQLSRQFNLEINVTAPYDGTWGYYAAHRLPR